MLKLKDIERVNHYCIRVKLIVVNSKYEKLMEIEKAGYKDYEVLGDYEVVAIRTEVVVDTINSYKKQSCEVKSVLVIELLNK